MLYVNGKDLYSYPEDSVYRKTFDKVLDRLGEASRKKDSFAVTFRMRPDKITTQYTDQERQINATPTEFVNYKKTITEKNENGRTRRVQYVYSPEPLPEGDNGKVDASKSVLGKWFFIGNRAEEMITDSELAFFLYHVHRKFGEKSRKAIYYLVDERSEATQQVESERKNAKFKYVLYGEDSPLNQDAKKLETIARAYGIDDVSSKDRDILLTELERKVRANEASGKEGLRGIDQFLEDTRLDYLVKVMAIVKQAEEQGIIGLNNQVNNMGVFWLDNNGEPVKKLTGLTYKTIDSWQYRAAEVLANPSNKGLLDGIKSDLGIATKEEEENAGEEIDPYEILDNWDNPDYKGKIKEICKSEDIQTFGKGRTRDAWKADLIAKWKERGWIEESYDDTSE